MAVNSDITSIAKTIRETVDCERIYLFGSHAYGTPHSESDYDFYVVLPDDAIEPLEAMKLIYRELSKTRMLVPVDVLAAHSSKFDRNSEMLTLERKVAREGVLLYERDDLTTTFRSR